ncbi:MAG: PKD domain-containing protein [Flavobacteriales bacterium]|jgi:gliding motility-associated-like protein
MTLFPYFNRILVIVICLFVQFDTLAQVTVNAAINNTTINTCNEFLIDSGGQGGPGYSNNEDVTFTICSDNPGDQVTVTFNLFDLSTVDTAPGNANNSDQMYVFDGPTTAANSLGNYGGNGLQGVVIQATPQNTSGCLTFQFVSNDDGTGAFTASASCNTPCATPQAGGFIVGGITPDSIRVCVGELVTFQEQGSFAQTGFNLESYTWDFMDGSQETVTTPGAQVQHAFTQPGNFLVQLFVNDDNPDNSCSNSNFISLDILVATIPDFIGFQEDETLCIGEEITFQATPELYEVTWNGFQGNVIIENGCLPDTLLGISQNIEIFQMGFLAGTNIESIDDIESICLEMEHSFMGDIVIFVTCPNGQQVMLHQQGGGGTQIGVPVQADNINCDDPATQGEAWEYCFTPDATTTWVEWVNNSGFGGTLPEGDYEPVASLDGLIGCPTNGVWTLTVVDNWAADDGQLVGFGLNLDASLYPEVVEYTPEILPGPSTSYWSNAPFATINDNNLDEINVVPTAVGEYTYEYTVIDDFGCSNDTSFTITVFDAADVTAPADFGVGCDALVLQGWYEGFPSPECSDCVEDLTYCYSDNDNQTWTYCTDNPGDGTSIALSFESGQMEAFFEDLTIYDGPNTTSPIIEAWSGGDATGMSWSAPSGCITITFTSDGSVSCNGGSFTNWIYSVQPALPGDIAQWSPDGYEWEWTPTAPLDNPTLQAPTIVNLDGQTTFTVTGFPIGHPDCASSDDVTVFLNQNQDAGDDREIFVCTTAAPFEMRDSLGGTPYALGEWMDVMENPLADGIFDPAVDAAGTFYHFIPAGCDTAELIINIIEPVEITTPNDTMLCDGGSVNLDTLSLLYGKAPYQFTWTYGGIAVGTSANTIYTPAESGEACLTVTDGCAYTATSCFQTDVLPPVEVLFSADTTNGCWPNGFNLAIDSDPSTFASSTWSISDGNTLLNQDPINVAFEYPGNYTVNLTLTNAAGCDYTAPQPITLASYSPPVAGYVASPQPTDIFDTEIQFTDMTQGYPITNYLWTFTTSTGEPLGGSAAANPVFEFPDGYGGTYIVNLQVTDIHNCTDVITPGIITIDDLLQFYIPSAFTPNNDGLNDVLKFEGADIDPTRFHLQIFNRYGEQMFETTDPSIPWTGNIRGGEHFAPNGVYNWIAIIVSKSTGVKRELNGDLIIMR